MLVRKYIETDNNYLISQIAKDQKENIFYTMDDVWGDFLEPAHGTTSVAVIANKKDP